MKRSVGPAVTVIVVIVALVVAFALWKLVFAKAGRQDLPEERAIKPTMNPTGTGAGMGLPADQGGGPGPEGAVPAQKTPPR